MKHLRITNTMSGKKETFTPRQDRKVSMYVCGVTPYDFSHMGHGRCYVVFDLVYRLLQFLRYDVTYCRNFTDIDDKLLSKAQTELGDSLRYHEIAQKFMKAYTEDMQALNCLSPDHEPLATETIDDMIKIIELLIENKRAYVVGNDVYYSVRSFADYGKLSKRKLDDLEVGARVQVSEKKRDPLDFALWKGEKEGIFWKSPWGYGRPGWHIECSAMSKKLLGEQIDIHAGGMDLIFPHHENEIAQSEGVFEKEFVKYWMHNAFITIDKEKMSKSLDNFFTLRDVFKKFDPMVIRYYLLSHYYRAPLDFSFQDLEAKTKSYQRLARAFEGLECSDTLQSQDIASSSVVSQMLDFLCDDLNTSGMFGVLFDKLSSLKDDKQEACKVKLFIQTVLGLTLQPLPEKTVEITPEIERMIQYRDEARKEKDWKRADELRDKLVALGVDLQDEKVK